MNRREARQIKFRFDKWLYINTTPNGKGVYSGQQDSRQLAGYASYKIQAANEYMKGNK